MNKPKIELKSIRINQTMSEETMCYSATLYADGKKVCVVGNSGHGGADRVMDGNYRDYEALDARVKATYPKWRSEVDDKEHETDLEMVCGEILEQFEKTQIVTRELKKRVLARDPATGNLKAWKPKNGATVATVLAYLKGQQPDRVFLNDLPIEQAVEEYFREQEPAAAAA